MILKRDFPYESFRYMLSNDKKFQTLKYFYKDTNSTIWIILLLISIFGVLFFSRNYCTIITYFLNLECISLKILCRIKSILKHIIIGNLEENENTKKKTKMEIRVSLRCASEGFLRTNMLFFF